jgi:hypothetical protein
MPEGYSEYKVSVAGSSRKGPMEFHIGVQISIYPGVDGACLVAPRERVPTDLPRNIEEVLRRKLPKLVNTHADKRILLLERDQIHPAPELIYEEVMKQRATCSRLAKIDEVWFVNTAFRDAHGSVDFTLIDDHGRIAGLIFRNGALIQGSYNRLHRGPLTE